MIKIDSFYEKPHSAKFWLSKIIEDPKLIWETHDKGPNYPPTLKNKL